MDSADARWELLCSKCEHVELCGPTQMLVRLRQLGMLKRAEDPALEEVLQLFAGSTARMPCQNCHSIGLVARESRDAEDDWDDARLCAVCGEPISADRLEVFPETTHCARCQSREESGGDPEPEYCPRCGAIMTMRQKSGSGVTRYVMFCPGCRR